MGLTNDAFMALEEIESVSSTNAKKQILADNMENNILFDILFWTYNPFYHYYMNKVELPNGVTSVKSSMRYAHHMVEFKRILGKLNARIETGNNARDMVQTFLKSCDNKEIKWYTRVLTRDLRCGISVKTINNVYGDVIKTFPVALAENPDVRVYPTNFRIDEKFDGYRCITEVKDNVAMYSRNGNDLLGYDEIINLLGMFKIRSDNFILDGELISSDFKGTQNNAFRKSDGKRAIYHVFDILKLDDFYSGGDEPLSLRAEKLDVFFKHLEWKCKDAKIDYSSCIKMVIPLLIYKNDKLILREDFAKAYHHRLGYMNPNGKFVRNVCDEAYAYALDCGLEGVIVKDLDSLYMPGKSYASTCTDVKRKDEKWYSWAKRKPIDTLDLVVQDVYEGTGENEGRLGGVNVIYTATNGKDYLVGVGSGFKKDERIYYWDNKNEIIGKTIEVHYDIETQDANGNYSLRFPRFKKVRGDK